MASFGDAGALDPRSPLALDAEVADCQRRCRELEQECAQMHAALAKGQADCERWRRKGSVRQCRSASLLEESGFEGASAIGRAPRTPERGAGAGRAEPRSAEPFELGEPISLVE
mmetsp:Transcript_97210/g.253319  ORF Transcript_97210/g.253319 Transcript_97210/m.253319 type:complete len:114 (-) Transcript_97210:48-389(-)